MNLLHDMSSQLNPADDLFYVETDIPAGVTINEYRRSRARKQSRWERLKEIAGGPGVATA